MNPVSENLVPLSTIQVFYGQLSFVYCYEIIIRNHSGLVFLSIPRKGMTSPSTTIDDGVKSKPSCKVQDSDAIPHVEPYPLQKAKAKASIQRSILGRRPLAIVDVDDADNVVCRSKPRVNLPISNEKMSDEQYVPLVLVLVLVYNK